MTSGPMLLVDDDEVFRERLAHALRQRGQEVVTAADGDQAVRAAERRKLAAARFVVTCTEANRTYLAERAGDTPVYRVYHGLNVDFPDLLERLAKAGYEGRIGLEYKPGDLPSDESFEWLPRPLRRA